MDEELRRALEFHIREAFRVVGDDYGRVYVNHVETRIEHRPRSLFMEQDFMRDTYIDRDWETVFAVL